MRSASGIAFHGGLAGGVHAHERNRREAGQGADVDDLPLLLPAHERQHGLRHSDDAEKVGLELGLGVLDGVLFQRPAQLIAGIVDQHVEPTGLTGHGVHARRHRGV
jgi:hypothetical protein